jgi:hypothetical protein
MAEMRVDGIPFRDSLCLTRWKKTICPIRDRHEMKNSRTVDNAYERPFGYLERISISFTRSTTGDTGITGMKKGSNNPSFSLPRDPRDPRGKSVFTVHRFEI